MSSSISASSDRKRTVCQVESMLGISDGSRAGELSLHVSSSQSQTSRAGAGNRFFSNNSKLFLDPDANDSEVLASKTPTMSSH